MNIVYIPLLCFVCAVGAGAQERLSKPYISKGFRESMGKSPWQAGIYLKTLTPYMQICGGTLVSRDVVISAAHCFFTNGVQQESEDYAVAVGKIYRPWNNAHDMGAQKSDVKEIKIPPFYQGSSANHQEDIALVILTNPFHYTRYVMPACLDFDYERNKEQLQEGSLGKVAGWGYTGKDSLSAQTLQYATLPVIDPVKCKNDSPADFRSSLTADKICAGYNNGTSVCHGDSGGGLLFPKTIGFKEVFFLRGVVSSAPPTSDNCNIYSWVTFTEVAKHERFIKSVLTEPDDNCPVQASAEHVEDRFTDNSGSPRMQRCQCTCPVGTQKSGDYCILKD